MCISVFIPINTRVCIRCECEPLIFPSCFLNWRCWWCKSPFFKPNAKPHSLSPWYERPVTFKYKSMCPRCMCVSVKCLKWLLMESSSVRFRYAGSGGDSAGHSPDALKRLDALHLLLGLFWHRGSSAVGGGAAQPLLPWTWHLQVRNLCGQTEQLRSDPASYFSNYCFIARNLLALLVLNPSRKF